MPPDGGRARTPGQCRRPVLGGRAARSDAPGRRSERTSSSSCIRRMIMRALTRQLPALVAVAAIAAASAACSSSSASPTASGSAAAQARRGAVRLPGHRHDRRRHARTWRRGPAPSSRCRRRRPRCSTRSARAARSRQSTADSDYPKQAPITKLSAYHPERRGHRRLQARPGHHLQRHRRDHRQADGAVDPGARPARPRPPWPTCTASSPSSGAATGHAGPGQGRGQHAEVGRRPDRRLDAAALRAADVLLRAVHGPVLLGDRRRRSSAACCRCSA